MNTLSVSDLNIWYGKFHALKDVSLGTLNSGEVVGLIGPNAAGKSTLLHALARPGKNIQKSIFNNENLSELSKSKRASIFGLMSQTPPEPSSLTPFELIWSVARALNLPMTDQQLHQQTEKLFTKFSLMDDAFKPLNTLSGGKRQLVGVVMLLIREPEICLLDEPTSALDLHWRLIVLEEIQNYVRQSEKIAIAALHDLNLASHYCDQLILIHEGKVFAKGKPSEVITGENLAQIYKVKADISNNHEGRLIINILGPTRT